VNAAASPAMARAIRQAARDQLAVANLRDFARQFWHLAHPGREVAWSRYLDVLCDEVQAAFTTPGALLVCMTPPRCGKSTVVNVLAPAWAWLHRPNGQTLNVSSTARLATRDALKTRNLIGSPEYQRLTRLVGVEVMLTGSQREKVEYETTAGGRRECIGADSGATGKGCDVLVMDDLVDAQEATLGSPERIRERMDEVWSKVTETWASRLNPQPGGGRGSIVCIAQSLHPDDPPHRLAREWGARVVCLPMLYDPEHPHRYAGDWRTEAGELLAPSLRSQAWCDAERGRLRERTWSTQYQQRPMLIEGGLLQRAWFREYRDDPETQARSCAQQIIAVDPAGIVEHVGEDFTVMQVWGRVGEYLFLLDEARGRWGIGEQWRQFQALCAKWPKAGVRVVENTVNGLELVRRCREHGVAVHPVGTGGKDKVERAGDFLWAAESGRIHVPDPRRFPWAADVLDEWIGFKAGAPRDDRVDAAAHAATRLLNRKLAVATRGGLRGLQ
jgi:predicted phage terminase large subunit-like protein